MDQFLDECSLLHRKISRFYQIGLYIIVLFTIIGSPFVYFWYLPNSVFIYYSIPYAVLLFAIIIVYYNIQNGWAKITKSHINDYFSNCHDKEHHCIIITHRTKPDGEGNYPISDYYDGIDILINFFNNNSRPIPFEIREITTKEDIIITICNPFAQYLWIFGHGQRNKIALRDDILCYKEIKTLLKKKFVGQYHCNSPWGTSLADITHAQESDVTIFPRYPILTRYAIKRKLRELRDKKMI